MEYNEFEKKFISELKKKDREILNTINNNAKLVEAHLQNTEKPVHINNIVEYLKDAILNEKESYDFYFEILNHPLMNVVYSALQESDVVLKAIYQNNLKAQEWLIEKSVINALRDKKGKNVPMYLLEQENYELYNKYFFKKSVREGKYEISIPFDINYRSEITNDCIVSIIINKYNEIYTCENIKEIKSKTGIEKIGQLSKLFSDLMILPGCDLNIAIDNEGNTPIMFFLMMEDYPTVSFLVTHYPDIDLSKKNIHGVNASFLSLFIKNEDYLVSAMINHETFDHNYLDQYQNSLLIYSIVNNNTFALHRLITKNEKVLNQVNCKHENAIIVATKLGVLKEINCSNYRDVNINQQDELGNTALYYAVYVKDKYAINLLSWYGADPHIKNNQGVSAIDKANEMKDEELINIINNPVDNKKKKEKSSNKGFSLFKKKDTNEYIDNYITNYQVDKFRKDYEYIIKNVHYSYTNRNKIDGIFNIIGKSYYSNIKSKGKLQTNKYIKLNRCDPAVNANNNNNNFYY
ncbi:ankyrin [Neocallimastix californiae]|jgi:hypothetical protein|uniref:Ankyrin n=1 Tax=Neocallimastix californiae TaxID=1754190 RepID=A0A1Y2D9A4_9FUNG|nr:ankyrin [Neocallimastix californiae]|eukprot:ORY55225.1 ankyrin [Neocallimastix californiae]